MYKLLSMNNEVFGAFKEENGVRISFTFDPANTDAQQFAKWLKDGNVPEPAVAGEQVTQEWIDQTIALLLPNG
jgi:hypothetical protein